ncbi:hypothetical protein Tco_0026040 [Tanacetum coccineum]
MTDAQLKALISQGVVDALAERDAEKSRNGEDSHDSGSDRRSRMSNQVCYLYSARKCSYVCPIGEIKKLEIEMWNLKVKGTDMVSYNQHFQELSLMCSRMFVEESDEIKKYVGGLPDMIHGSIRTIAERQTENKRKFDDKSSDNNAQQPPFNRQNVTRAYSARSSEKKKSDYPELKNRNHGNQTGGTEARGMVYALGGGETNQDPNNMEDDINA